MKVKVPYLLHVQQDLRMHYFPIYHQFNKASWTFYMQIMSSHPDNKPYHVNRLVNGCSLASFSWHRLVTVYFTFESMLVIHAPTTILDCESRLQLWPHSVTKWEHDYHFFGQKVVLKPSHDYYVFRLLARHPIMAGDWRMWLFTLVIQWFHEHLKGVGFAILTAPREVISCLWYTIRSSILQFLPSSWYAGRVGSEWKTWYDSTHDMHFVLYK